MSDLGTFLNNLIEKFDIKKLTICAFIVLALMVIPNINFLDFLMPLDDAEKWIKFIFALVTTYILISIIVFLWECIKKYYKYKPKNIFFMMSDYGGYINIFYSEEINEYSASDHDLHRYGVPRDVINKLLENNIIKYVAFDNDKYQLTKKARKKLTRIRKIIIFIDSKIFKKNKDK